MTNKAHFFNWPYLWGLVCGVALLAAPLFHLATLDTAHAASGDCVTSGNQVTCTYEYTGAAQTWTVPDGVTASTFDVFGAQGGTRTTFGSPSGGLGGQATATIAVTPGQTLQINVGGIGGVGGGLFPAKTGGAGGFNGGGRGGDGCCTSPGGGGGASDVRAGAYGLTDRLIVAGGGGGSGSGGVGSGSVGGGGGGISGETGGVPGFGESFGVGGSGGTQSAGGLGGAKATSDVGSASAGENGGLGTGGAGGNGGRGFNDGSGGGGGGYYGGGGGGGGYFGSGGGGGSGYITPAATNATLTAGVRSGDGLISITYLLPDPTAPEISPTIVGTLGANGWYTSDVSVSWNVTDAESTISKQSGCEQQSVTSDTGGVTFTCAASSAGGSNSQSVTIKRDATAPTISAATTGAPNGNGWYNSDVTVTFTCADNLSGVAGCPADESLSSEGSAISSTAQAISDLAGNSSASGNIVTVQIDKTAPVVTVTGVSNGASYTLGSVPTAGCSTTDALAGVATQATVSVTGGNSNGTGSFTATCSGATDIAGNTGSVSISYTVVYNWSGFFQPVDNLPVVNTVNAGQAIPVRFSLGGDLGLNIFAGGYPVSQQMSCGSGGSGSTSPIEETITAGGSSLQYDPTTQTYAYVWKTDKAWAGTCRQLIVRLIDGTDHIALFQFNGKARIAGDEGSTVEGEETIVVQQLFLPLVNR